MLRRIFGKMAPMRGEVMELLHHELLGDIDWYQAKVRLTNGREVEMVMNQGTYQPGRQVSAIFSKPMEKDWGESFPSKTGLPVLFVENTLAHRKNSGRITTLLDRFVRADQCEELDIAFHDDKAIQPATEEREKLKEEGVEYGERFVEFADLEPYNKLTNG